jgi:hypothetical protein
MLGHISLPEKVPKHLEELKNACCNHLYGREIDETEYSNIAFTLLDGGPDALKKAGEFIQKTKREHKFSLECYDKIRNDAISVLFNQCVSTLPRPRDYMECGTGPDKLLKLSEQLKEVVKQAQNEAWYVENRARVGEVLIAAKCLVEQLIPTYPKKD